MPCRAPGKRDAGGLKGVTMGNATHIEAKAEPRSGDRDCLQDLSALRGELAKYRRIFDSASLIVGHEFAKPLTAAGGYLDLLEGRLGEVADERAREYFAKMRDSLGRLEELVESFVQMLRVENGAGDLKARERVAVRDLIDSVRARFEEHAASISVRIEGELPPLLLRRRCLEVVLENLISNALKHGGAERPISVTARLRVDRRASPPGSVLVIAVEDHGAGIPEDKLEEIFTPFVRLDEGGATDGLGLGLALVKNIIAILNGEIDVSSTRGKGTTVTVAIPVASDAGPAPDTVG